MGPDVRYGLLHGRLSSAEKAAALDAFASGATNLLIATTVVEARPPLHVFYAPSPSAHAAHRVLHYSDAPCCPRPPSPICRTCRATAGSDVAADSQVLTAYRWGSMCPRRA